MKLFSLRAHECVSVGNDVVVEVLEVCPDRVRLGVTDRRQTPSYSEFEIPLADAGEEAFVETYEPRVIHTMN